ncbi:MAG: serine protease [Rhodothalassiaceae bacterium]
MARRREILIYAVLIALAFLRYADVSPPGHGSDRPRRPEPEDGGPSIETIPKTRSTLGTAFLVSSDGLWATAAHVSESCDRLEIRMPEGAGLQVGAVHDVPGQDLAIMRTKPVAGVPFLLAPSSPRPGSLGRHLGFPGGQSGMVVSRYMGGAVMRLHGRVERSERVDAWAEIVRYPSNLTGLGGISGGPTLDREGRVLGINSAATVRRGRVYSVPVLTLGAALADIFTAAHLPSGDAGHDEVEGPSSALRPVLCHVGSGTAGRPAEGRKG